MKIINEKIKELYKSKALFSEKLGIDPKDYSKKFRAFKNAIAFANNFLTHLNLEVTIKHKSEPQE
jgi:hypothetical protein